MRRSNWLVVVFGVSTLCSGCELEDLPFFPSPPEEDDAVEGTVVVGEFPEPEDGVVVEPSEGISTNGGPELGTPIVGVLWVGDIRLSSDEDISTFCDLHVAVEGNVTLSGEGIASLTGLSCLRSVSGDLIVESAPALTSLQGLEGLTLLGGALRFADLPLVSAIRIPPGLGSLHSLDVEGPFAEDAVLIGLDAVSDLEGELRIAGSGLVSVSGPGALASVGSLVLEDAVDLTDLSGLASLSLVDGDAQITGCESLISIDGLSALSRVSGDLVLDWNISLSSLEGLAALETVGGSAELGRLRYVEELSGLRSLTGVGGDLTISDMARLEDLDGLGALRLIDGSLLIDDNTRLQRVDGLSGIGGLGGDLSITFNPWLSTSRAEALRDTIGTDNIVGTITIRDNAEG